MLFSLLYIVLRAVLRLAPAGNQRDREGQSHADPLEIAPEVKRRDLLGGLIHEYYPVAA
jgi:hypothetical protein